MATLIMINVACQAQADSALTSSSLMPTMLAIWSMTILTFPIMLSRFRDVATAIIRQASIQLPFIRAEAASRTATIWLSPAASSAEARSSVAEMVTMINRARNVRIASTVLWWRSQKPLRLSIDRPRLWIMAGSDVPNVMTAKASTPAMAFWMSGTESWNALTRPLIAGIRSRLIASTVG